MPSPPLRAAVAGLGMMGHVGVVALERDPRWTVAAVADRAATARDRARAVAPDAVAFDDATALVDAAVLDRHGIDVVLVMTPPDSHAALALSALAAGRHVLCEKPMARTPAEAGAMAAAASAGRDRGLVAVVDHQLRYNRARRWIGDRLAEGALGPPRHVQVVAGFPGLAASPWTWWSSRAAGGGLLNEYGSHTVDLLHWWFGPSSGADGVVRTVVTERTDADGRPRPVDSDDLASFRLRWRSGLFADVVLSGVASDPARTVTVHGDDGSVALDGDDRVTWHRRGRVEPDVVDLRETEPSLIGQPGETYTQPFARLLADLATHVRAGTPPPDAAGFDEGLGIVEALASVRAGAAAGPRRDPTPDPPVEAP